MNKKAAIALGIGIGVVAAVGITAAVMYNKKMKEQEEDIELLLRMVKTAKQILLFASATQ